MQCHKVKVGGFMWTWWLLKKTASLDKDTVWASGQTMEARTFRTEMTIWLQGDFSWLHLLSHCIYFICSIGFCWWLSWGYCLCRCNHLVCHPICTFGYKQLLELFLKNENPTLKITIDNLGEELPQNVFVELCFSEVKAFENPRCRDELCR